MQSETRSIQKQKFYQSTVAAMNAEKATAGDTKASSHLSHTDREQPAFRSSEEYTYTVGDDEEQPAIPRAPPEPQQQLKDSEPVTEEIPIAGRTKMTVTKEKGGDEIKTDAETEAVSVHEDEEEEEEEKKQQKLEHEQQKVKAELNEMLKRSPIVIFSKSYCPFSRKAKTVLLEKYSIVPAPFVVELDQHPLGPQLQSLLGENTGRRTVPNVLVNGRSIGGGDDIVALDEHDELASRLKSLAGKWLQEVERKEADGAN
ncbi:glutaredoxin [Aspergillus foveolatus]|uniref:glutaredoxin n=1 Tax=Aspergillus foveolatus TaxID=210207 RepID=UPI003CCD2B21